MSALEERLRSLGTADTALFPPGATIVPDPDATLGEADISTDATLAAGPAASEEELRSLPRLSVDLRGSLAPAPGPAAPSDLEVRDLLGEGGMGRVLLARQHSLARDVAVKTSKDGAPPSARGALLREGRITGQLEHPAIVPVHAIGLDAEGRPALVMKRIEGSSWDELLDDPAHPGWEDWPGTPEDRLPGHLAILEQVCQALHFAHSRGILHRDVKPENVLIGIFGDVYLADWGVACALGDADERLCGTPVYMAPEMVTPGPVDERTDVFLLGAVLHEILTGRPRHDRETALQALMAARLAEPATYDDEVPTELARIANRACHRDPAERFESARAFRDALRSYVEHSDSLELAREATNRFEAGQALLRQELDADGRRQLDAHLAAARFGLEQALAQWPQNALAVATLGELERVEEAQRERALAFERVARDNDPRVAARARALALSCIAVLGVVLGVVTVGLPQAEVTHTHMLIIPSGMLVTMLLGAFAFRKQLGVTAFNRRATLCVLLMMVVMTVRRVAMYASGDMEIVDVFGGDSFLIGGIFAAMGITLLRWVGILAVLSILGGVGVYLVPDHALDIFGVVMSTNMVLAAVLGWKTR